MAAFAPGMEASVALVGDLDIEIGGQYPLDQVRGIGLIFNHQQARFACAVLRALAELRNHARQAVRNP